MNSIFNDTKKNTMLVTVEQKSILETLGARQIYSLPVVDVINVSTLWFGKAI